MFNHHKPSELRNITNFLFRVSLVLYLQFQTLILLAAHEKSLLGLSNAKRSSY
jgi:hypothetical protein